MNNSTVVHYEITPPKGFVRINLPELWRYRELFYIFVWRDVKVRYKQTILGIAWAIFQPFLTMLIFTIFFDRLGKIPSENIPYPIFVYAGLLLWNYYSTALTGATNSLDANEGIIKKIYFPRLILPFSNTITPMLDFGFALIVLFGLMAYYHFVPHYLGIALIPLLLILSFISASGLGLFLAAINTKYRDVRYILPFFLQILLFVTPVIYPISIVPQKFAWLLFFNPMAGVISVARSTLLGTPLPAWNLLGLSAVMSIALFILGVWYFRKTEQFFADIL